MSSLAGVLVLVFLGSIGIGPESFGATDYLAFGDLRGYLEPCGCDPKTDLGGVRRISGLLQRERLLGKAFLALSTGNNVPEVYDPVKAKFIVLSLKEMSLDAVLWNRLEQAAGPKIAPYVKGVPFVKTNGLNPDHVRPYIQLGEVVIFGYSSVEADLSAEDRGKLAAGVSAHAKKVRVLLFSGSDSALKAIEAKGWYTDIISANTTPLGRDPTQIEKDEPGRLLRTQATYMVPSFGQGMLRGGKMRLAEAATLTSILGPTKSAKGSFMDLGPTHLVTWLSVDQKVAGALASLWSDYERARGGQFETLMAARKRDLKDSPFAGAVACRGCHSKAFEVWEKSFHASAHETLKRKGKDQDMECVACHSVGFTEKGGFAGLANSPHLAGVQCENCHGAAKAHAMDPVKSKPEGLAAGVCIKCHHQPHSSNFNFEAYWVKIRHGDSIP